MSSFARLSGALAAAWLLVAAVLAAAPASAQDVDDPVGPPVPVTLSFETAGPIDIGDNRMNIEWSAEYPSEYEGGTLEFWFSPNESPLHFWPHPDEDSCRDIAEGVIGCSAELDGGGTVSGNFSVNPEIYDLPILGDRVSFDVRTWVRYFNNPWESGPYFLFIGEEGVYEEGEEPADPPTETPSESPTSAAPSESEAPSSSADAKPDTLPATGTSSSLPLAIAAAAILTGAGVLLLARRRSADA